MSQGQIEQDKQTDQGQCVHRHQSREFAEWQQQTEIQQGDFVPVDFGQVGDAGQVPFAVHGDKHRGHRFVPRFKRVHGVHHSRLVLLALEQQMDGVLLRRTFADRAKVDEFLIAVNLNGAGMVYEQAGDARHVFFDDIVDK